MKDNVLAVLLIAIVLNAGIPIKVNKSGFSAAVSPTFDKSYNGYGWYQGYSRKIQVNHDPVAGSAVGSLYRQLNTTYGTGTMGGMTGDWEGTSFNNVHQTVYSQSIYQSSGTFPGGRYPSSSEFIKGYYFGLFNDMNTLYSGEVSQAMFTVCDARMGWNAPEWLLPKRIEAVQGGSTPPAAWLGLGDVAYNQNDGYFYWTTNWKQTLEATGRYNFAVGRSKTPADSESWEWTDYRYYNFDTTTAQGVTGISGKWQISYAKDIYGNGTGKGIAVAMFVDETYIMTDSLGLQEDVTSHPRLGYIYTTNWGAEWKDGQYIPNWITPNDSKNNLFSADIYELFDWYGTYNLEGIKMDWPYFNWEISAVTTENNFVHVLVKAFGGSTDNQDYAYYLNSEKVIAGYYDIVGEITEIGVTWHSANYIAAIMGIDDTNIEYFNILPTHSIGYAGNGVVYASWLDRPYSDYLLSPFLGMGSKYICDAYFTHSSDNGATWEINQADSFDYNETGTIFHLNYAQNVTNTKELQDQGFCVASHGSVENGMLTVFAACQYYDPLLPNSYPSVFEDNQQYLKVWKIQGSVSQGGIGSVTVASPDGNEILSASFQKEILWTDNIDGNVVIDLYKNGTYFQTVTEATESDGSYLWTIPSNMKGNDFKIKISSLEDSLVFDMSCQNFSIIPGKIWITSPDGGEVLSRGSELQINWIDNLAENIKIELLKNEAVYSTVISSTPSTGTYSMLLPPELTGDDFKIKLSSVIMPVLYNDKSDGYFSIAPDAPTNVRVSTSTDSVSINWDISVGAQSYLIYSSDNPYSGFNYVSTVGRNSWESVIEPDLKQFYYIVSSTEESKKINSSGSKLKGRR